MWRCEMGWVYDRLGIYRILWKAIADYKHVLFESNEFHYSRHKVCCCFQWNELYVRLYAAVYMWWARVQRFSGSSVKFNVIFITFSFKSIFQLWHFISNLKFILKNHKCLFKCARYNILCGKKKWFFFRWGDGWFNHLLNCSNFFFADES